MIPNDFDKARLITFDARRKKFLVSVVRAVFIRDQMTCRYCGDQASHIDHVIPVSFGGTNDIENLVAACPFCNQRVSDKVFDTFADKKAYLAQFEDDRIRRRRRKRSLCGDCGYPFNPGVFGATNVLCDVCARIDDELNLIRKRVAS